MGGGYARLTVRRLAGPAAGWAMAALSKWFPWRETLRRIVGTTR
jgi:hypothetical protein